MISIDSNIQFRKGNLGEKFVRERLERAGYIVYCPVTDGAHAFDMMAINKKLTTIALDIKTKAHRTRFPDTGVDRKHFDIYQKFSIEHRMPFFLFFVDENAKKIYGNRLDLLEQYSTVGNRAYPRDEKDGRSGKIIRYWPVNRMTVWAEITDLEAQELRDMSQRNYEYPISCVSEQEVNMLENIAELQRQFHQKTFDF